MSVLIAIRRWIRPDQPQPNYKAATPGLFEALDGIHVAADYARKVGVVTPARARLSLAAHLTVPALVLFATLPVAGVTDAQTLPARLQAAQSYRVDGRAGLESRHLTAPNDGWGQPVVDRIVAGWLPAFVEAQAYRTPDRQPSIDVRRVEQPSDAWRLTVLTPIIASWRPAFDAGLSYVVPARPGLDVRRVEAPSDAWRQRVVDAQVATWRPALEARPDRVGARQGLDVRLLTDPSLAWVTVAAGAPAPTQAQLWPGIAPTSYRVGEGVRLDVRRVDAPAPAWIFSAVPPPTQAQLWPGIAPVSFLVPARPGLDVRRVDPPEGVWFVTLPAGATQAQLWPAILQSVPLSNRTPDRARLDVRGYQWAPAGDAWQVAVVSNVRGHNTLQPYITVYMWRRIS